MLEAAQALYADRAAAARLSARPASTFTMYEQKRGQRPSKPAQEALSRCNATEATDRQHGNN
jgi:hypothetical protein